MADLASQAAAGGEVTSHLDILNLVIKQQLILLGICCSLLSQDLLVAAPQAGPLGLLSLPAILLCCWGGVSGFRRVRLVPLQGNLVA